MIERRARGSCARPACEPGLFTDVRPNPVAANVEAGVAAPSRRASHDGVVALGGGSALDCGKVSRLHGRPGPGRCGTSRMSATGGSARRPDGIAPVVAIPTTAGTGSEVGRAGVITDEATHTKKIIFHPGMMPKTAILDPEVTVGLPRQPHGRHRHGRAGALPRGLLRAHLASDGRGHRRRGHPAGQGGPAARLRRRPRPRRPRHDAGRLRHGRRRRSRRAWAPSTASATRSARSTTPTTA